MVARADASREWTRMQDTVTPATRASIKRPPSALVLSLSFLPLLGFLPFFLGLGLVHGQDWLYLLNGQTPA